MASCNSHGYIVIPNWDEFQHYKDRAPAWIKLHLNLLGNDAWLDLSPEDRCVLITIWMLTGRYGNGRVKADYGWIMQQAKVGYGPRSRNLERLNHAGFITFSASALPKKVASVEVEGSKEPKKERKSARASSAANTAARTHAENGHEPSRDDTLNRDGIAAALAALKTAAKETEMKRVDL
jgi:hypothetical protein